MPRKTGPGAITWAYVPWHTVWPGTDRQSWVWYVNVAYVSQLCPSAARKTRWLGPVLVHGELCSSVKRLCQLDPCRIRLCSCVPMSWHTSVPLSYAFPRGCEWDCLERSRTPYHQQAQGPYDSKNQRQQGRRNVEVYGEQYREISPGPVICWPQSSLGLQGQGYWAKVLWWSSLSEWHLCSLPSADGLPGALCHRNQGPLRRMVTVGEWYCFLDLQKNQPLLF